MLNEIIAIIGRCPVCGRYFHGPMDYWWCPYCGPSISSKAMEQIEQLNNRVEILERTVEEYKNQENEK